MKTETQIEVTVWSHPAWDMDLMLAGGPDETRHRAEGYAPDHERECLSFECRTMPEDEYQSLEEFSG